MTETTRSPAFLVTHSGSFHADDVLAAAVLGRLFPLVDLKRTREPSELETFRNTPNIILFDVGGSYSPEMNNFDHHQVEALRREDGLKYSAFGLVWRHYGMEYLERVAPKIDPEIRAKAHAAVDEQIVRPIDEIDNGITHPNELGRLAPLSLPVLIADYTRRDDASQDSLFRKAAFLAGGFFEASVRATAKKIMDLENARKAILEQAPSPILEVETNDGVAEAIAELGADHLLYRVYLGDPGEWCVRVVTLTPETYETRQDLPAEWAGLRDADLASVSGVEDAIFCHAKRFIAIAGSREGAMRLARRAVDLTPQPELGGLDG